MNSSSSLNSSSSSSSLALFMKATNSSKLTLLSLFSSIDFITLDQYVLERRSMPPASNAFFISFRLKLPLLSESSRLKARSRFSFVSKSCLSVVIVMNSEYSTMPVLPCSVVLLRTSRTI